MEVSGPEIDLFVIGGGVNGCGIARDAAGRGLSVVLVEKDDLAQGTSSASTKLFHGGLRYLEYFRFGLVRESLRERATLHEMMPHISHPMRFVLPVNSELAYQNDTSPLGRMLRLVPGLAGRRPAWLMRAGLFVYDNLGGRRKLPACRTIDLSKHPAGGPLSEQFRRGFEFSDCWVDDSRLVILNARSAAEHGAVIHTRTNFTGAVRENGAWRVTALGAGGKAHEWRARAIVNAAGPWAATVIGAGIAEAQKHELRLVRGSHIVTRRLFDHDHPYFLQLDDGRIIFAIPYERRFTLIGTTDIDHSGDPGDARCTPGERDYLLKAANRFFAKPVSASDIVSSFAGVRPLLDEGAGPASAATRDFSIKVDGDVGAPPLVNVLGGKITTYRRLAERVMDALAPTFPDIKGHWSSGEPLPGGDFSEAGKDRAVCVIQRKYPFLDMEWAERMVSAYGLDAVHILVGATGTTHLGRHFGGTLYAREIAWMRNMEWARTAEDVLWRRSKLGLVLDEKQTVAIDKFMAETNWSLYPRYKIHGRAGKSRLQCALRNP